MQSYIILHIPELTKPGPGHSFCSPSRTVCTEETIHCTSFPALRHLFITTHDVTPITDGVLHIIMSKFSKKFKTDFWSLNVLLSLDMFNHTIQHYWVKASQNFSAVALARILFIPLLAVATTPPAFVWFCFLLSDCFISHGKHSNDSSIVFCVSIMSIWKW